MKIKKLQKNTGFALLFSVLVSSLLLTIGLSIFNIALKELAISTATRQSVHAFYAADSGLEYAKYRDLKIGDFPDVTSYLLNPDFSTSSTTPEAMPVVTGSDGPNFKVTVTKNRTGGTTQKIDTTITSLGYDTADGDRVERAIFQSY